jgi:hypothetical protein
MGYSYKSLIDDGELIQGDSSDITLFFTDMDTDLSSGNWEAKYTIRSGFDEPAIIERDLPLNTEPIQDIPVNGCFVHQILSSESEQLASGVKYIVTVQIKNTSTGYSGEVAQFKLKIKPQGA